MERRSFPWNHAVRACCPGNDTANLHFFSFLDSIRRLVWRQPGFLKPRLTSILIEGSDHVGHFPCVFDIGISYKSGYVPTEYFLSLTCVEFMEQQRVELCIQTNLCCNCLLLCLDRRIRFTAWALVIHFRTTECDAYEMSCFCFFEYVTLHTRSYHHRPKLVHDQEVSMTFQERHEAGLHEGLVNIALNGEAFKTHAWRLRKSSVSSLSHMSYNRILWTLKNVGVR